MTVWKPLSWDLYPLCTECGVPAGKPCTALSWGAGGVAPGAPVTKPHPGRRQVTTSHRGRRVDPEVTAERLATWKRLAQRGVHVHDIAHQLGMKRAALDRFIVRARKRGHPDAVYHAHVQRI